MARAPYWLHATMAELSVAFFVSTLAIVANFPLPHGQTSLCRMFPVKPQRTNTPTSAIDDNNDGITNTPAAPATPEPRVRTLDLAVPGLGRRLRQLQIVLLNKNGTATDSAAAPERQPMHRQSNNKNQQQQTLQLAQRLRGKRRTWRLHRLREERKKKEKAEAVIQEQLAGREDENNEGQTTLMQRLRGTPGHRRYRSVLRELVLARKKAKKSNGKGRDGKAKPATVANTGLLQGLLGRPLPIWVL